jgi:hypothetical protein
MRPRVVFGRTGRRPNTTVTIERRGRLVQRLSSYQAGLRHDVTTFTYQALVDRQVVDSG